MFLNICIYIESRELFLYVSIIVPYRYRGRFPRQFSIRLLFVHHYAKANDRRKPRTPKRISKHSYLSSFH